PIKACALPLACGSMNPPISPTRSHITSSPPLASQQPCVSRAHGNDRCVSLIASDAFFQPLNALSKQFQPLAQETQVLIDTRLLGRDHLVQDLDFPFQVLDIGTKLREFLGVGEDAHDSSLRVTRRPAR